MIPKIRTRTGSGASGGGSFGELAAYISHESKALEVRCSDKVLSLETAAAEMEFVALAADRIQNPLYHFVLSWPNTDRVQHNEIFRSVEGSLSALGFTPSKFQWVAAIHGDSNYQHVHTLVNRVNPVDLRVNAPRLDRKALDRFCRQQEVAHGWTRDTGALKIDELNEIVPNRDRYTAGAPISGAAQERNMDGRSLISKVARHDAGQ